MTDDEIVEAGARLLAKSDGLNFDEVCGVDADPDEGYCDSSTCVAAYYEDHEADTARSNYRDYMRALLPLIAQVRGSGTETGWLIELPLTASGGGRLCWVALGEEPFPRYKTLSHNEDYDFQQAKSPLEFTPDHNRALRFARKEDADTFMKVFERFLLHAVVTEHQWLPTPPAQEDRP